MLKQIGQIRNLGQFENFASNRELSMNNIIFGFNGAGKSTLSDMFYSLAHIDHDELIIRRRTLNREGEEGEKKIDIEIHKDDGESYLFSSNGWNTQPNNMYVFNAQYIKEHVFVSRQLEGDTVSIMLGKEGAKYMRQKEMYSNHNNDLINDINRNIKILMEADIKIKDFSSSKVTNRTPDRKYKQMAEMPLYPVADKEKVDERLKKNEKYTKKILLLERCNELYDRIDSVEVVSLSSFKKCITRVPKITSKEIALYLSQSLNSTDIKWAVRGYLIQKDRNICPMCGQKIADEQAKQFFAKLGKYICQNKDKKIKKLSSELQQLAYILETIKIDEKITVFREIIKCLEDNDLILKKEAMRFEKGLSWNKQNTDIVDNIIEKIRQKAENPFIEIDLSQDENDTIKLLNSVIKNFQIINTVLQNARERVEKKNEKRISMEEVGKLFDLSYGGYRSIAEDIKANSAQILKNREKIAELSEKINDCYNQNHLNSVNDFLMQLNTHIKIEVSHNNYFIKLKDFQEKSYEQSRETLLSEGERNAVAFAYFLTEIENVREEKIIVIDDPISSMDLSRKSIISHKISEMMNNNLYQIIVMTHDISFVERVVSYLDKKQEESTAVACHANSMCHVSAKFYMTTGNAVQTQASDVNKNIILQSEYATGSQVLEFDSSGNITKHITYSHKIYTISYYDTKDGYLRFLVKVGKTETGESIVNYKFDVVKLVGKELIYDGISFYTDGYLQDYKEGNDVYYDRSSKKLYVTMFKKESNNSILNNIIIQYDLGTIENGKHYAPALAYRIDAKNNETKFEIEGMRIADNTKYACANTNGGDKIYSLK